MNEKAILNAITETAPFAPLALSFLADANYLCIVFKTQIVCSLADLLEKGTFDEETCKFYIACIALAIDHLHGSSIIYRNVVPESLCVTSDGFVQLMDMSNAFKMDDGADKPRDYTGSAHYLSPEQVSASGHSYSVDYWALGIVMYEMLLGQNPWLTGDDAKDTELGIYGKISAHKTGGFTGTGLSANAEHFLNGLLDPTADGRLGTRGVGAEELRAASWMTGFNWTELMSKTTVPPHASSTAGITPPKASLGDKYSGDGSWCKDFSSFTAA